jgi:hypothetical protein
MNTNNGLPLDESNHGKYIIIKIPRTSLQGNTIDSSTLFSHQTINRRTLRTIGLIITFLLGIIIGSIFHGRILSVHSDHATWKMFTTTTNTKK